jgi:predicted MFS family arabinose efflux permease
MGVRQEGSGHSLLLFILIRLAFNTTYRMIYPFLKVFAVGMGVPLQTAVLPLTGRSLVGVFGPLLAPVADRYGRKTGMLFGLALFSLGTGIVAIWPTFPAFFLALVLANLGNQVFLPAMQAYLGDRIPYERRGRTLALTELSWSISFIVLVPLAGVIISRLGWAAPFWLLLGGGLLSLLFVAWRVPHDPAHIVMRGPAIWNNLRLVAANPSARLALFLSFLITAANEVVNLVFGAWMGDQFHLEIAALGLAATVIGIAELSGESATALLVDRIGKKRSVRAGLVITSLAALSLPILGGSQVGALMGLFLFYLGFEFTLVSYIPVMTEVLPEARATLMSANLAAFSLGRALGALAGTWLYVLGFEANALAALLLNAVAMIALSRLKVSE